MAAPVEKRAQAREMYVREALPPSVIAARLGVTERTILRWKSEDGSAGSDWNKSRVALKLTKENIEATTQVYLEEFLSFHKQVLDEVKANLELTIQEKVAAITSLTDAFNKSVRACALTAPQLNQLAIASDVIQRLAAFITERHPDAATNLLTVLEPFGQELAKYYG
jgi:hypothetical protein